MHTTLSKKTNWFNFFGLLVLHCSWQHPTWKAWQMSIPILFTLVEVCFTSSEVVLGRHLCGGGGGGAAQQKVFILLVYESPEGPGMSVQHWWCGEQNIPALVQDVVQTC